MTKYGSFQPEQIEKIVSRFGKDFYEKVQTNLEHYGDKLNLTSMELVPSYSANLVFKCNSSNGERAVLKIGNPRFGEFAAEIHALMEFSGRGLCKLYASDEENSVILEECIEPGLTLREEVSLDKRLSVFTSLYKQLHIPSTNPDSYPSYLDWVCRITDYMSNRQDCVEFYTYMKKAKDICLSVSNSYTRQMLLHGDFHHDNILLRSDGKYIIIDPKGVVGDPVFDVPRFILNEFDQDITADTYQKIIYIIDSLEKSLSLPREILKQCLYVETAMAVCWDIQDGALPEGDGRLMETIELAEAILNRA